MKRSIALIVAYLFLLASFAWAAEEVRQLGMNSATGGTSGDIRVGNTCTTSPLGKYYCGVNSRHISFFSDNAVSVDLLYPLASATTGFPYVSGGTWGIDNQLAHIARFCTGTKDNTTYLRMDGSCAVPPGGGTGNGDMLKSAYDANDDGVVDSAIATAVTNDLIVNADINTSADIAGSKMLDNSVAVGKIQCTGTKDGTTYLRMDGTCAAVSAVPAGDNAQLQYNKEGAWGAVNSAGYDNVAETLTLPPTIAPSFTATQTTAAGCMKLFEPSAGGSSMTGFCAPALADNVFYTLPTGDGNSGDVIQTNGSKVLSWVAPGTATSVPQSANPTVDGAGEVAIDTTGDQFLFYGGALNILMAKRTESFVVKSPTTADNTYLFKAPFPITLAAVDCITDGATKTVTMQLQECGADGTSCGNTLTSSLVCDSNSQNTTSFSDASVATGAWMKLIISAVENSPGFVSATVQFAPTRQ